MHVDCHNDDNNDCDLFPGVTAFRRRFISNFIFAHLNINSYRHKYISIHDILAKKHVDYLAISESKLDASFPSAQFPAQDYILSIDKMFLRLAAACSFMFVQICPTETTTVLSCIYKHPKLRNDVWNATSLMWLILSLKLTVILYFLEIWTVALRKVPWYKIFVIFMA